MKVPRQLAALAFAAILSACSGNLSAPNDAEAREAFEKDIRDFSQGCVRLLEFHKTSDIELGNVMLVKADAEIEFLEDCDWPIDTIVLVNKILPGDTPNARKGDRRTVNLTLQFHRTGLGWKVTGKKVP